MSSSDRRSMLVAIVALIVAALLVYWYLGRKPVIDEVRVAPPERVEVTIDPDGEYCQFTASPDVVELHKIGTDKHPNAGIWDWVGEPRGYEAMWLVLKDNGLRNCLPFVSIPQDKQGFEIPRGGSDAKKVKNDVACKLGEYDYGLMARHADGSFLECDPKVKILD